MAETPTEGQRVLTHFKNCSQLAWRTWRRAQDVNLIWGMRRLGWHLELFRWLYSNVHSFSFKCTWGCLCKLKLCKHGWILTSSVGCSCVPQDQYQGLANLPKISHTWSFQELVLERALRCLLGGAVAAGPESIGAFLPFSQHLSDAPTFQADYNKENFMNILTEKNHLKWLIYSTWLQNCWRDVWPTFWDKQHPEKIVSSTGESLLCLDVVNRAQCRAERAHHYPVGFETVCILEAWSQPLSCDPECSASSLLKDLPAVEESLLSAWIPSAASAPRTLHQTDSKLSWP